MAEHSNQLKLHLQPLTPPTEKDAGEPAQPVLPVIEIYTDGSCVPNPGTGGWAAVLIDSQREVRTIRGDAPDTTNNRMELTAALRALESLTEPHGVLLYTDSRYLKDGITRWLASWQRHGWRTAGGEPVRNRDLWQSLARQLARHTISWHWLKGHAANKWNEMADELARAERQKRMLPLGDQQAVHLFLAISWQHQKQQGAWSCILRFREHCKVLGGVSRGGSANKVALLGAVQGLKALKKILPVHMYTTSGYLRDGAERWLTGWQQRQWRTSEGQEVSNRQEWQELAALLKVVSVRIHLVDRGEPPCHTQEAKEMARELLAAASVS